MFAPGGRSVHGKESPEYFNISNICHLDATLAPKRVNKRWLQNFDKLCWVAQGKDQAERLRIGYDSEEYPQGEFLLHVLDNGFTAIQWWDRCQGDQRGACNSTVLLEGVHIADEMLKALSENFPHVLENLTRAGITLRDVTPSSASPA